MLDLTIYVLSCDNVTGVASVKLSCDNAAKVACVTSSDSII